MTGKTAVVRARVDATLKKSSTMVLDELNIDMSEAIRLFLAQVILQKGLPFQVKIPRPKSP